jgi:hypothetical protein
MRALAVFLAISTASIAATAGEASDDQDVVQESQTRAQSCTAQWLERRRHLPLRERYNRASADAFGRRCLGITGRVPIDWRAARHRLEAVIGPDHELTRQVPVDIASFCPGYAEMSYDSRAAFWRTLAIAVIKPEAGTNAHAIMWEQPRDRARNPLPNAGEYSIGLLQLSISNARPYRCDVPDEASLLDPQRNLDCGIKIMTRLVSRDNRIGGERGHGREGLGRYWSTIRVISEKPPGSSHRETRQPIIDETRALTQCH